MTASSEFELTPKQREQRDLAASDAMHILAFGGSRAMKTFGFCRCIAARAIQAPESRHGIFRLHNIDVRQSVMMDTWPKMMSLAFPDIKYHVHKSDQYIELEDSEVWFGGLDDKERVEKILGKEFATIFPNECSQISFDAIVKLRTRLAQNAYKRDGRRLPLKAYYDLNPVGKSHWSYIEFIKKQRPSDRLPLRDPSSRVHLQMNPVDNPYLAEEYIESLKDLPTRDRERFLAGNYLSDVPGSLWPTDVIDKGRVELAPQLGRIVIGVDPSGGDGNGHDSQGIVVVGLAASNPLHAYVLEDATCSKSPAGWGKLICDLFHYYQADCVIAESNYGGAMVENTIKTADENVPVKLVTASRGKHVRAEPVSALYDETENRGPRVHHVGYFTDLEDQLGMFTTTGFQGSGSPDRADALVWAITELLLEDQQPKTPGLLVKSAARKNQHVNSA